MTADLVGRYRVGIDIGGTFTDLTIVDDETGTLTAGKVLTTPADPSLGVEQVLAEALAVGGIPAGELRHLVHGTTLVTNAIIERTGARTALLASRGFRDSIEIGREHRFHLYDLMIELPKPLVPRHLRFDVPQRLLADGTVAEELDEAHVERLARELDEAGVEAVAICFLHAFTNPEPERRAREAVLRAAPGLRVSISSEVVPEIREFERASTTVANVYVQARVEGYLSGLQARLRRLGFAGRFFTMLSSGGMATAEVASRFPVRLVESGPAAGALAAASYGLESGRPDLLSFDMGGTTAKLCVIEDGRPLVAHEFEVDRAYRLKRGSGLPLKVPVIDMIEIGVGGGSIARVGALGLLSVGPDSAGADPGPACYGQGGGEPTVTDADLVLGYLDPGYFLGGRMALDLAAARAAIERRVASPLALSLERAAWGIHQIVNENMSNAARVHTVERGQDPRKLPLFAFGGAGPVHGFRIAALLGAPSLVVPFGAGVTSTVGFLAAPLAFDFVRTAYARLDGLDWARAEAVFGELEAEGEALLRASGVAAGEIAHARLADVRYVGQGHEVRVPVPAAGGAAALLESFEGVYRRLYGRSGPPVPVETINWRVVSSGPAPELRLAPPAPGDGDPAAALKGERPAWFPELDGFAATPVYDRYRLGPGAALEGPAIIEERESTAIVPPGARARIDEQGNLVAERSE